MGFTYAIPPHQSATPVDHTFGAAARWQLNGVARGGAGMTAERREGWRGDDEGNALARGRSRASATRALPASAGVTGYPEYGFPV